MKLDMVLIADNSEHLVSICNTLHCFGLDTSYIENTYDIKAGLSSHSPAFLLLDCNIKDAEFLLVEIANGLFRPYPYVIVSSAQSDGASHAELLRLGADICIDSPITADEVLAVVKAVQRRERRIAGLNFGRLLPCIEYKDLAIDPLRRAVTMKGTLITLTAKEFDVLYVLASHAGIVLTKKEIYQAVWKGRYLPTATNVSDQISSLRRKLGFNKEDTRYIQTVIGVGYRFGVMEQDIKLLP